MPFISWERVAGVADEAAFGAAALAGAAGALPLASPPLVWASAVMVRLKAAATERKVRMVISILGRKYHQSIAWRGHKAVSDIGDVVEMVRPERFELPTYWFEASCSIRLSYGRMLMSLSRWARLMSAAGGVCLRSSHSEHRCGAD